VDLIDKQKEGYSASQAMLSEKEKETSLQQNAAV
jgi:hypothetical protein